MRHVVGLMLAVGVLALGGCGDSQPSGLATDAAPSASESDVPDAVSPVLTAKRMNGYPAALVRETLAVRAGCLMLGTNLVVWPAGTTWDESTRSVTFSGDFEGAPGVSIGSAWEGGGGYYEPATDAEFLLGDADVAGRLAECIARAEPSGVVLTYPSFEG